MAAPWIYQSSWGSGSPTTTEGAGAHVVVGNMVTFDKDGAIVGARFFRSGADDGEHIAAILNAADNALLGVQRFHYLDSGADGTWQHCYFTPQVKVTTGQSYYVLVDFEAYRISYTLDALTGTSIVNGRVTAVQDSESNWNGIFGYGFGRDGWDHSPGTRWGVDVLYLPKGGT